MKKRKIYKFVAFKRIYHIISKQKDKTEKNNDTPNRCVVKKNILPAKSNYPTVPHRRNKKQTLIVPLSSNNPTLFCTAVNQWPNILPIETRRNTLPSAFPDA